MSKRLILIALLLWGLSACSGNPLNIAPATSETAATETVVTLPPTDPPAEVSPTDTPVPTDTSAPTATAAPVAYGPDNFPSQINPLTGQPVSDIILLERRPVAIKIQMFPRGQRPPWGISLADIVFDFYQNNGVTRLHAIFHSQDAETVGPIRSARLLDIDLVHMYQSIFAFGSAESRTFQRLYNNDFASRLVIEGYAKCPPMCRTDPNGSNSLVSNTNELSNYISAQGVDNSRQNLDGMSFAALTPPGGQPGDRVYVRYSIAAYNRWDYDPTTGFFMHYQDTLEAPDFQSEAYAALTDRLTGAQVSASNVVVLFAPHKYAYGSSAGANEVFDITLEGQGKAYAFRDGQMFELAWNRPGKNSVIFLTFPDGTPYAFKPGNTWFHVIGKSSKVEFTSDNAWRFTLAVP